MNTRGLTDVFVDQSFRSLDVNRRLRRRSFSQLRPQLRARLRVEEVAKQKQIEMGRRSRLRHLSASLFENNSILEHATIKTRVEQTRERVAGRFDNRLAHAIER